MADVDQVAPESALKASASVGHLVHGVAGELSRHDLFYGHGTDNPDDEACALVFAVLDISPGEAETAWKNAVSAEDINRVGDCLHRRINERLPLPYLTGVAWFAGMPFHINECALVPRSPIAELLERGYSPWLWPRHELRILDMCTGSGCIGIATAAHMIDATVDIVDISASVLALARRNVDAHGLSERVNLVQSDLFEALEGRQYDLIVSNPPYVPHASMLALPVEYTHEPVLALEAGDEGMAIVDKILRQSGRFLKENGMLIVEVGEIQSAVEARYNDLPFTWLAFERGGEGVFLLGKADLPDQY